MRNRAEMYAHPDFSKISADVARVKAALSPVAIASITVTAGLFLLTWLQKTGLTAHSPATSPFLNAYTAWFGGKIGFIFAMFSLCAALYVACRENRAFWIFCSLAIACAALPQISAYSPEALYVLRPAGLLSIGFALLAVAVAFAPDSGGKYALRCGGIGVLLFASALFDIVNGAFAIAGFCVFYAFHTFPHPTEPGEKFGRFCEAAFIATPAICLITYAYVQAYEIFIALRSPYSQFPALLPFAWLALARIGEKRFTFLALVTSNPPIAFPAVILFILALISGGAA